MLFYWKCQWHTFFSLGWLRWKRDNLLNMNLKSNIISIVLSSYAMRSRRSTFLQLLPRLYRYVHVGLHFYNCYPGFYRWRTPSSSVRPSCHTVVYNRLSLCLVIVWRHGSTTNIRMSAVISFQRLFVMCCVLHIL